MAASGGGAWNDLLVRVFSRRQNQESIIIPAVPEPLIVWVLSGCAVVEERELGGTWLSNKVARNDFFLTNSPRPCELRWTAEGTEPFEVMHVYLGLPLIKRAIRDLFDRDDANAELREVSGAKDEDISSLLRLLHKELNPRRTASALLVQGIGQSLAVHLVRSYSDPDARKNAHRGGLPAFKLQKVIHLLESRLDRDLGLHELAHAAGLSDFHFSRTFKQATGLAPSTYFIRLRMSAARRLLRETGDPIVQVGLSVGYSSPSHFAQIFRREVGVSPTEYRDAK